MRDSNSQPMDPHMNSSQMPLWNYAMLRHKYWRRLRPRICDDIRDIVDRYFYTEEDPVKCWEEVETLLPVGWMHDPDLHALLELLMDCTTSSRFFNDS